MRILCIDCDWISLSFGQCVSACDRLAVLPRAGHSKKLMCVWCGVLTQLARYLARLSCEKIVGKNQKNLFFYFKIHASCAASTQATTHAHDKWTRACIGSPLDEGINMWIVINHLSLFCGKSSESKRNCQIYFTSSCGLCWSNTLKIEMQVFDFKIILDLLLLFSMLSRFLGRFQNEVQLLFC